MRAAVVTSFDQPVVLAADPKVLEQAHASLRRGGRLILPAQGQRHVAADLPDRAEGHPGDRSIVGTRADLAEVFRLHAAGRTRVFYETRPLEQISEAIDDVLACRVPARLVLIP